MVEAVMGLTLGRSNNGGLLLVEAIQIANNCHCRILEGQVHHCVPVTVRQHTTGNTDSLSFAADDAHVSHVLVAEGVQGAELTGGGCKSDLG